MKPTVVIEGARVQTVLGLKEYSVLDWDDHAVGQCPFCGGVLRDLYDEVQPHEIYCDCNVDWDHIKDNAELAQILSRLQSNGKGETFTLTAYHAGDLPKDVQEKIAEENRHYFVEDEWWYEAEEDYYKTEILKKVGLGCEKIFFSLFGQGQHAYLHKPHIDDMRVLLKHLGYDLRKRLPRAIMEYEAEVEIDEHSRGSFGWNSVSIYLYRDDYPNCDDDIAKMEGAIKSLIEGIMRKYREDLEKIYESATSDDYIIEGMDANDKLFYETGDEIPFRIVDALRKEAKE